MPSQNTFTTVRSEGGLLPSDLLARVVAGDSELGGLLPTDYGFPPSERLGEAISRLWNDAKTYWEAFKTDQKALESGETGVSETRDWVLRLLRELGYGRPEFRASAEEINGRRYPIQHRSGPVPLHILSFQQDIDHAAVAAAGQPRLSPHALLQEYLNASDAALYGIVTNGLHLRLLRDNASITRLAAVEFDLETMFELSIYADFVLLFLLLHRTRLPQEGQEASACWLEIWRGKAETQGTRALGALRAGVEKAIEALGNGLLAHTANADLRDQLRRGELTTLDFYAELLRLVYRVIFLFVAEERDLLHPDGARPEMRLRYADNYGANRLRGLARRFRTDERHDDLWRSLRVTFDVLAGRRDGLDLVALEGLFAVDACPHADAAMLGNNFLAEAVLYLSNVRVDKRVRRVNYRDIGAEELGGVYEGLLERQPCVAVDAPIGHRFELVGGGQRRATGSYYTPASLVHELIKSALEPVIADRLARGGSDRFAQERALLDISICDAACGSGHFLLAAARRLGAELARLRSEDREPGQRELRRAMRDVVRNCIYGVDLNPLAVDLCRLSLWLESQDKGRPLSFLDHHIKLGNSLVGATPELLDYGIPDGAYDPVSEDDKSISSVLKKRNKLERGNQLRLFGMDESDWRLQRAALAEHMLTLTMLPEDVAGDVRRVRESYEAYRREQIDPARLRLDTWTAAFFWSLTPEAPPAPTTFDLRTGQGSNAAGLSHRQLVEVNRLRDGFRFFHWPLEFPEVFQRGGFDCVLGNPPWERVEMDEEEFFSNRDPSLARLAGARRKTAISELRSSDPDLWGEFQQSSRQAAAVTKYVKQGRRFPLGGSGRINLYALFAEHNRELLGDRARAGIIVPTGIATDDSTKAFFQDLVARKSLASLFDFQNHEGLFRGVGHGRYKFSLITISSTPINQGELAFFLSEVSQIRNEQRRFQLTPQDFQLLNPNTGTCPVFRTRADADLTIAIYRRLPVLVDDRTGYNPWRLEFMQGLFNMTSDSGLFQNSAGSGRAPLYEAKLFHQFNHRYGSYSDRAPGSQDSELPRPSLSALEDPNYSVTPRYWVSAAEVDARLQRRWDRRWLVAFRDIARAVDERTAIFAVLPRVGIGHKAPLVFSDCSPRHVAALYANFNSLVCDYLVRQKIGGTSLSFFIVKQVPIIPPSEYTAADLEFIVPRVLELTFTAWDLKPFADDLGYTGEPFRWDEDRRARLRADLDALFAALFGLTRDELRYILDPQDVYGSDFPGETFRIHRERQMRQHDEYRTRRLVLEAWDRLGLQPRNRDGRNDAHPVNSHSASPSNGNTAATVSRISDQSGQALPVSSASPQLLTPPLILKQQVAPNRTSASQSTLPGLRSDEISLRSRALELAMQIIATGAPINAKDIAQRLAHIDARIDRSLVNSVLHHEGVTLVGYEDATGMYRPKQTR